MFTLLCELPFSASSNEEMLQCQEHRRINKLLPLLLIDKQIESGECFREFCVYTHRCEKIIYFLPRRPHSTICTVIFRVVGIIQQNIMTYPTFSNCHNMFIKGTGYKIIRLSFKPPDFSTNMNLLDHIDLVVT